MKIMKTMNSIIEIINEKQNNDCVDLDLPSGTKWATCNIGANKPEEYGLLFQWGRTDGYKYNDRNHKFLSKDDYVTTSGTEYRKDTLKSEDDAAYQATNGIFRMPTSNEIKELIEYTTNEYTELNGIEGRKFISKKDDSKWIFIPAAGCFNGISGMFFNASYSNNMWSSSVNSDHNDCVYSLDFSSGDCGRYGSNCCFGFSVRGVLNK